MGFRNAVAVFFFASVLKLLFISMYRSTDFEVHRNWLAITHSVPFSQWYFEATSPWTLDYPPLFGCFEWVLSHAAAFVDPAMLRVENLEYASHATVVFQRVSVIVCDAVLFAGSLRAGRAVAPNLDASVPAMLLLLNPALMMIDHIHFQYNGMMLGLLLLSAAEIELGNVYRGAFLFCILVNMKHIFLYVGPVYLVYLLRWHCGCAFSSPFVTLRVPHFLRLAVLVLATLAAVWTPIILTGQLMQAVSRLFPFGRGLTHAYWAPNIWALYNTADRVLAKLGFAGPTGGQSSTGGFAEVYESSVLWTIPPKFTFLLTACFYVPLLVFIWQRTPASSLESGRKQRGGDFFFYVAMGSAISFSVGWHVHEKAILQVTVPLLMAALGSHSPKFVEATTALSVLATFSVLPLLPQRRTETIVKWIMLLGGHMLELTTMRSNCSPSSTPSGMLRVGFLPGPLVALGIAALGAYADFGIHQICFGRKMEFLPLLFVSDFSAVLVLWSFARLTWLVAAGEASFSKPKADS